MCARPRLDRRKRNDCGTRSIPAAVPGSQGKQPGEPAPGGSAGPQPGVAPGAAVGSAAGTANRYANPSRTSSIDMPGFKPPLRLRWDIAADATEVLAADGRVFVGDKTSMRALDAATGAVLWTRELSTRTAAYDRGLLFVGGSDGVTAVDGATGVTRWNSRIGGLPVATNGELYALVDGVMRMDPQTGAILWRHTLEYGFPWPTALTLDATRVFATNTCGALSRATGQRLNTFQQCGSPNYPVAPFAAGRLFNTNSTDALLDTDAATGAVVERRESYAPAISGNTIVLSGPGLDAFDLTTWTPLWSVPPVDYGNSTAIPPVIIGPYVYWAANDGKLRAYELATGAQVWSTSLGFLWKYYERQHHMAVGEGLLLVPDGERVLAYEVA